MRYKIIDVYKKHDIERYIAKCLKKKSPQYVILESPRKLCRELDIVVVDQDTLSATWATGEMLGLKVINTFDQLDKIYEIES